MAKFVLSGRTDSVEYARAEILGDLLCANLEHFDLFKVPVESSEWPAWLTQACTERGWKFDAGPVLIWRELIDRGGKGLLLGGLKEFEEYAKHYYNLSVDLPADKFSEIVLDNTSELERKINDEQRRTRLQPAIVTVTNASCPLAYHLVHQLSCSSIFRDDNGVEFRLLGDDLESVQGVRMEVEDLALPHVRSIQACTSVKDAFSNARIVFLLDYVGSHQEGIKDDETEFKDAVVMYHSYARVLDFRSDKSVRVLFSGRYAEIGVGVFAATATSLDSQNMVAPMQSTALQATSILAQKLNINSSNIRNVIAWGSKHQSCLHTDLTQAKVHSYEGSIVGPQWYSRPVKECIHDHDWLKQEFPTLLKDRENGSGYRCDGPLVAQAVMLTQFLQHWNEGSDGSIFSASMFVPESCSLCPDVVPRNCVASLPCTAKGGKLACVTDLIESMPEDTKESLKESIQPLHKAMQTALEVMKTNAHFSP